MRILICNERFLFRFGVDRVLLILASFWRKAGHEVIMMGNKLDSKAVDKCSDRFIYIPENPDYFNGNEFTEDYIKQHWDDWFNEENKPDVAFIAGWPFLTSLKLLREKCGCSVYHDHGIVPTDGMNEGTVKIINKLKDLKCANLAFCNEVIAISDFIEKSQSIPHCQNKTKTIKILHGVDHLDLKIWGKEDLNLSQENVIPKIKEFKENGYKIIFMPGRWEIGNYKNSAASFDVIRRVKKSGFKVKILVLAKSKDMEKIPNDLIDNYFCMGFVDDQTMRQAMELSDLGFCPTLWEGFDLPLAEMQYLNKCMYVLNIGSHPEVVMHPFFLCENNQELADKIITTLEHKLPFSTSELDTLFSNYRESLTWMKCSEKILKELKNAIFEATTLFVDVTNACRDTANSGVMRVTRKVSRQLQKKMNTIFVMWDESINKYVFPYPDEVERLCSYGGPCSNLIKYISMDGCARKCLEDILPNLEKSKKIFLYTETVWYKKMQQTIPYLHKLGMKIAAIFYDAIAIKRPDFCNFEVTNNHKYYMAELSNCDLVIPIAKHNQIDLEDFWKENKLVPTKLKSIQLAGEMDNVVRNVEKSIYYPQEKINILFVSTLEPRKNHIRLLKAFELLMQHHPELLEKVVLNLVGNKYAENDEIPRFVQNFCEKYSNVHWFGVVDDEKLKQLYRDCSFTVYPSEIEGYGMPIVESQWFGKPCICSNEGSIAELGNDKGCLLTDVHDIDAMEKSLYNLIVNGDLYITLQNKSTTCKIETWDGYSNSIVNAFKELIWCKNNKNQSYLTPSMLLKISELLKDKVSSNRIIVASNFYPPKIVGGAEIIAHNQAKFLKNKFKIPVIAFSLEFAETNNKNTLSMSEYDDIICFRFAVSGSNFDVNQINFFNRELDKCFDELCKIFNPTVFHGHNLIGMSLGLIDVAKNNNAKVCLTLHDNWGFCFKNTILNNYGSICKSFHDCLKCLKYLNSRGNIPINIRQNYFKYILSKVDAFVSPSAYQANNYIRAGFSFEKMNVIWNGINLEKFRNLKKIQSDKLRISFVGYFGKHKGIDLLIKAVAFLDNKNVEINLVGEGDQYQYYIQLAHELKIQNQIKFWGKVENSEIEKVYSETDIYCLPSIWPENQPVSITEAMSCGIPVIASNAGGNAELVKNGKNGFLFEVNNYLDLAEKINNFIKNPKLIFTMGKNGQEIISCFDFEKQVAKLLNLYNSISEKNNLKSDGIIAIKGFNMPNNLLYCSYNNIFSIDWCDINEYKNIKTCIVLENEKLSKDEISLLDKNIKLIVASGFEHNYDKMFSNVYTYANDEELLELI